MWVKKKAPKHPYRLFINESVPFIQQNRFVPENVSAN